MARLHSSNRIVRNALASRTGVAKNAAGDLLVTLTTITAKGLEKVQAKMSPSYFETWAAKVGVRQELQGVWLSLMKGDQREIQLPSFIATVKAL